jgi:adenine deaminase
VVAEVGLPLWGMLSDKPYDEVIVGLRSVHRAIREDLGSPFRGIHTGAGFTCLAVSIPSLKISSYGLVEVVRGGPQELVDLFVN